MRWFASLSLFIEAITPLYFFLGGSVYAAVLFWLGDRVGAVIFISTLLLVFVVVFLLKVITSVERRKDARITLNHHDRAFPSGHAAAVAFLVPMVTLTAPWGMPLLTAIVFSIIGVLVGLSRLSLKVHTLFQVVAGALIGTGIPLIVECTTRFVI